MSRPSPRRSRSPARLPLGVALAAASLGPARAEPATSEVVLEELSVVGRGGLAPETADHVGRCLGQIVGVRAVF